MNTLISLKKVRLASVGVLVQDASYPFLIQANYQAGYFTHYAGEGTIKSCKLTHKGRR